MSKQIHLGRLLGRKVFDPSGKFAGRIEEVHAHKDARGDCVIEEYMLGREALMERLSVAGASEFLVHLLGGRRGKTSHKVPWDKMDLTDADHPRIICAVADLKEVG
jgi:hypothetical protein